MKATVILSFFILLISCGEVANKTPEISQARRDSLETMIADLDGEIGIISDNSADSHHPIIINLTAAKDSLEALLT